MCMSSNTPFVARIATVIVDPDEQRQCRPVRRIEAVAGDLVRRHRQEHRFVEPSQLATLHDVGLAREGNGDVAGGGERRGDRRSIARLRIAAGVHAVRGRQQTGHERSQRRRADELCA
jgi:hypothetical protein